MSQMPKRPNAYSRNVNFDRPVLK